MKFPTRPLELHQNPNLQPGEGGLRKEHVGFATWHPQWGGYASGCLVTFSKVTGAYSHDTGPEPGCFEVYNWHNGDFPIAFTGEDRPVHYHYCSAEQIVRFGVDILVKQHELQCAEDGAALYPREGFIDEMVAALNALRRPKP